jgi:DNA-binding NtrC family response regulator
MNNGVSTNSAPAASLPERVRLAMWRIADCDCPILLVGERGAGKRWIARELHVRSHRFRLPYRELACAGLNREALLAAVSCPGTLCLVEISQLDPSLQSLLLESYFRCEAAPSCSLICTSSSEPFSEVRESMLGEELHFAISAVTLRVPPLRCRRYEIRALIDGLLIEYAKQFDRPKPVLCGDMLRFLVEHSWPGNFSELHTAVKTIVAIDDQDVSFAALKAASSRRMNGQTPPNLKQAARQASSTIERQLISEALTSNRGNRKRTAEELGISYKALLNKLKRIDVSPVARRQGTE